MSKLFYSIFTLGLFFSLSAFAHPGDSEKVVINLEKSTVSWMGKKVTGKHVGVINIKEASLEMEEGQLSGGSFTIDMTSIKVTEEGGFVAKLEGHLKSDDFFGVEAHPTANFVITKVASLGTPGDYKITGNLTIKDITKEIKFQANVGEASATAEITIDRSDFNVRYGSGSFFDNLGDKTIYDDFYLTVNLALGE